MCYSNKTESVSLRKCTHDDLITNKVHLSTVTVTNSSQSFYLQDGNKNKLAQTWNKITSLSHYVLFNSHNNCQL